MEFQVEKEEDTWFKSSCVVDYKAQVSWMYNSEYIIFTIKSSNLDVYRRLISWYIKVLNLASLIQLEIKTLKKNSKPENYRENSNLHHRSD